MDQKKIEKAIFDRFNSLQPEIQEAIMDPGYEGKLIKISQKYNLTGEQLKKLELNTTLVLLGEIYPDDYEKELEEDIQVNTQVIKNIVFDINETILKDIRDILKNNWDEDERAFNKLNSKFSTLPENLQGAISKSNYQAKVYEFGKKYGLTVEQMGVLEEIITKIILGEIQTNQFENKLSEKLTLPKEKLDELIKDTNKDIFEDIRHILESNWEENKNKQQNNQKIGTPIPVPIPPYAKKEEPPVPKTLPILNKEDDEKTKKNIIEEKLNTHTKSGNSISDYSLPKMNSNKDYSGKDPYREEI